MSRSFGISSEEKSRIYLEFYKIMELKKMKIKEIINSIILKQMNLINEKLEINLLK
jgi:hypothetical protein